jgi:hypothetical protein
MLMKYMWEAKEMTENSIQKGGITILEFWSNRGEN